MESRGAVRRFAEEDATAGGPYLPIAGDQDDNRLNQLGYKQELRRSLSSLSSFATTFNIVSVITGITTLYEMGLSFGGPVTMVYGWPIVGCMTMLVGLSMAEICSAYPTSGGLYFWSAKLCGNGWGPFAAWLTGWLIIKFKREEPIIHTHFIEFQILFSESFTIHSFIHAPSPLTTVNMVSAVNIAAGDGNGNGNSLDSGTSRLRELGYKQELKRDLSVFSNFAFSFAIISVLTGITTLYNTGLKFGGPVSLLYGWFMAGFFTMFVGSAMGEICSAYPTSGGLYYWSAMLAGPSWAPFASWITGWFNIVGQWAVTTSVDFSLAQMIQVIILLSTGGKNGGGYEASKYVVIAIYAGILFLHALMNSLPISLLSFFGQLAAAWNLLGVLLLTILIPTVATERASSEFVFAHFNTDNEDGINNKLYIFVLGLLMSQYTLTGYDASAHMTEETKNADRNGPKGIISAIGISVIFGWLYILGITYAVTDIPSLLSENNDAGGYAIAEIFYQAFKRRYGTGVGGIICLGVIAVAIFFCGMSSVTSNSRMAYAFSRDGAMPFSSLWHKVNNQDVPINAVWLSVVISFCMALTYLGSTVAFQAMVSIATIGLYIAYAFPIFFRVTLARKTFVRGPFHLGRYGDVVGWIAVIWVVTISVLFSLPVAYPITIENLNYTPVAVGGLFLIVVSGWVFSARKWFKGPADLNEELEPLFDYRRVQPTNFICIDDDESPVCAAKKRKKNSKPDIDNAKDDEVEVIEIVKRTVEEEEDWLAPPPKVSVDIRKQHCEDDTVRQLRLKTEELLQSLAKSANEVFLATEESRRKLVHDSPDDSDPNVAKTLGETAKTAKPASERAKIVISVQGQSGSKQFRFYKDDSFAIFFKNYAKMAKVEVQDLVFSFDGEKISPNATPAGLDMEDEDIIEVHSKKPLK
ncbi:Amino-acid permease BAT1 [Linum perenne]